jgi:hypothetical protein
MHESVSLHEVKEIYQGCVICGGERNVCKLLLENLQNNLLQDYLKPMLKKSQQNYNWV